MRSSRPPLQGLPLVVTAQSNMLSQGQVLGPQVVQQGTLAARPAASIAGRLYLASDVGGGTFYRDTGAAWVQVGGSVVQSLTSCRVWNSASINVPDVTVTYITYDSERWDPDAMHDPAVNPGRLTCVRAGKHLVWFTQEVSTGIVGAHYKQGTIVLSKADLSFTRRAVGLFIAPGQSINVQQTLAAMTLVDMVVGDYVEFNVYQNTGGARSAFGSSATEWNTSEAAMIWLSS